MPRRVDVKDLRAFCDLVRIDHGVMYGFAVLIGIILAHGELNLLAAFGFAAALFVEMGIFAMNDFFDYKIDKWNRRLDRPLVRGDVSRRFALTFSICALILGNAFASFISYPAFSIAFVFSVLAIAYNFWIKRYALIGNIFIAVTMAVPFFFGGIIAGQITDSISTLAAIVFVAGIGREIMKDIQDIKGDKKFRMKTLPIIVGPKRAVYSAVVCFAIAIVLSLIPFFTFFVGKIQYLLILITDALYIYTSYKILNITQANLQTGRALTLLGAVIALIAFFASSALTLAQR